jgi:uncharacterized protein
MTVQLSPSVLKPDVAKKRLVSLDILRGVALLGILLITMPKFALPERYLEGILQDPESINFKVAYFVNIVLEGKMRALFSMIFGAGILLFVADKEKSGRSVTPVFYSRMAWLAFFGLVHAHVLLAGGDILYFYSLCGMFLFFFRHAKPLWLIGAALSILFFEMVTDTYFYNHSRSQRMEYLEVKKVEDQGVPLTDSQLKAKTEWLEKEKGYFPTRAKIDQNTELMRSQYWTIAGALRKTLILKQTRVAPFLMAEPMALMLLGMALFQWGFLSGQLQRKFYIWGLTIGYGIGFPLGLYLWNYSLSYPNPVEFMEANVFDIGTYLYPVQRILLTLGHVSLILLLVRAGVFKGLFKAIGAVGKMAFTNYILQTIICTFIFFGYGLGYFGYVEYYQLYFIIVAIWTFQLVLSSVWLRYFRFGPLEWVWRSLTYWKRQPMLLPRHDTTVLPQPGF